MTEPTDQAVQPTDEQINLFGTAVVATFLERCLDENLDSGALPYHTFNLLDQDDRDLLLSLIGAQVWSVMGEVTNAVLQVARGEAEEPAAHTLVGQLLHQQRKGS